VADVTKRA
jgi:midasin